MTWETPELTEIRMDAELGSYQSDDDGSSPDRADPGDAEPARG